MFIESFAASIIAPIVKRFGERQSAHLPEFYKVQSSNVAEEDEWSTRRMKVVKKRMSEAPLDLVYHLPAPRTKKRTER